MQKKNLPYNHEQLMFRKFQNLWQGSRSVDDYAMEFFKMINRVELQDTEQQLVMRFIGGLRQQIQFTLNLFRPQSISEAHQQALTVEAQTRNGFSTWGSSRQTRSMPTPASSVTTPSEPAAPNTDTAIVLVDTQRQTRQGGFRCYSCGKLGIAKRLVQTKLVEASFSTIRTTKTMILSLTTTVTSKNSCPI